MYAEIQQNLSASGYATNEQFGLPPTAMNLLSLLDQIQQEGPEQLRLKAEQTISKFNLEQQNMFNEIVGALLPGLSCHNLDGSPDPLRAYAQRLFFVDGPGSTGKTFATSAVQRYIRSRALKVLTVASSAVAAHLLDDGRTTHSALKIPIPVHHQSTCAININSTLAEELCNTSLFIWDEIVMTHRHNLEAFDRTFRDIMRSTLPFGGKGFLCLGDFRQTLPVVRASNRSQIVNACFKRSTIFPLFKALQLRKNMQLQALHRDENANEDALQFPSFLLKVGEGKLQVEEKETITLPSSVKCFTDISRVIIQVFPDIRSNYQNNSWMRERAVLTTRNIQLEKINGTVRSMIPGEERVFLSADKVENAEENELRYPGELLNAIPGTASMPDHQLILKPDFIVMLLRNLQPANGHVNRVRYIVNSMTNNVLFLRSVYGRRNTRRFILPRVPCDPGDEDFPLSGFSRTQFPVRVCFAITTNKAQRQSFGGALGIDLRHECCTHMQLYVALSKITHPSKIAVCNTEDNSTKTNVVYRSVFSNA